MHPDGAADMGIRTETRRMSRLAVGILAATITCMWHAAPAAASGWLIRDAEIEAVIRDMSEPVLHAAGLDPETVHIAVINARGINAVATGDNRIFLNSGLIEASETYPVLLSVIAHETAHISSGHVIRRIEQYTTALSQASAFTALALLFGIVGGQPELVIAGATASQQIAQQTFLRYTRNEETSADTEGVGFLEKSGVDPVALLTLMHMLRRTQETYGDLDPYALSHPIASERIRNLQNLVDKSPQRGAKTDADLDYRYARIRTKLGAFLARIPAEAEARYAGSDTEEALLGLAIARHRAGNREGAIATVDRLLQKRPDDPYYHELRGQILFESGATDLAVLSYRRAVELAPDEPLILTSLGQALLSLQTREADSEARAVLKRAVAKDDLDPGSRRLLAVAFARAGDEAHAALMTAEERLILGDAASAVLFAQRAQSASTEGSPTWHRAQDILTVLDTVIQEN